MTGGKIFVCQWPFYLGLRPRYRDTNAREHVVHQHVVDMALADQVAHEHAWRLIGLLDALRQTLPADLFRLLLHIAHELFRQFAVVASEGQVTCCAASESGRARGSTDGVTAWRPEGWHM